MKARTLALFVTLGLLLIFLSGCKNDVDKFIGFIDDMAKIAEDNKDDCDKMTEELEKYVKDKDGDIKAVVESLKKDDSMTQSQEDNFDSANTKFTEAAGECIGAQGVYFELLTRLQ